MNAACSYMALIADLSAHFGVAWSLAALRCAHIAARAAGFSLAYAAMYADLRFLLAALQAAFAAFALRLLLYAAIAALRSGLLAYAVAAALPAGLLAYADLAAVPAGLLAYADLAALPAGLLLRPVWHAQQDLLLTSLSLMCPCLHGLPVK